MQSTETEREHDACGVGFIYRPVKTHRVIKDALEALCKIEHRGALGADDESGDGAGILAEIPWAILEKENLPVSQIRAVGVVFLPAENQDSCRQAATDFLENRNFNVLGWRKVPVRPEVLGPDARKTCPEIEFVLLAPRDDLSEIEFEKKLVVTRKLLINSLAKLPFAQGFYIASMSSRSIVYKAMTKSVVLAKFYLDLQDESYVSNWAVFHRRFSTNTNPNWRLAQPFRMLGHNGEINTLSGNRNWLHAREMIMDNPLFTDRRDVLRPMVHPLGSDSANLDNLFELFVLSGLSPQEAMMRLIPEAHSELHTDADPHLTAFYNYHAALQEPWDGPALIVFSDGKTVGASLDRNGLRPARYTVLKDGSVILCSETGVLDLDISEIAEKGRLGPGQMLAVDLSNGEIQHDFDIKKAVSRLHPYTDWLSDERTKLDPQFAYTPPSFSQDELLAQQIAAGYGEEDLEQIIGVMADTGHEPVFSMGDDAALAVLSKHPRSMFDYFRQKFAQVTNPPIDHLRERLVFSLDCFLGKKSTVLTPARESAHLLALSSPILTEANLAQIESLTSLPSARVSPLLDKVTGSLTETLDRICQEAAAAVERGCQIIILSDRPGSSKTVAAPAVLAVGAVHNYLTENSLRMNCSLVVETAQTWSTHQFACLLGFGAEAICPYLAFETIRSEEN